MIPCMWAQASLRTCRGDLGVRKAVDLTLAFLGSMHATEQLVLNLLFEAELTEDTLNTEAMALWSETADCEQHCRAHQKCGMVF